ADGRREGLRIGGGGPGDPGNLADVLEGGRLDLVHRGRGLEVVQHADVPTHAPQSATPATGPGKRRKSPPHSADTGVVVDQSTQRIQSFRTTPDGGGRRLDGPSPVTAAHGQATSAGPYDLHDASTGELVGQAAGQISTLVRTELALAKAELIERGKKLGIGGGMLAAAALFSLFSLGLVIALIVAVLDIDWPLWLAVLVPLLALGVLTLTLAGLGIRRLRAGASA